MYSIGLLARMGSPIPVPPEPVFNVGPSGGKITAHWGDPDARVPFAVPELQWEVRLFTVRKKVPDPGAWHYYTLTFDTGLVARNLNIFLYSVIMDTADNSSPYDIQNLTLQIASNTLFRGSVAFDEFTVWNT